MITFTSIADLDRLADDDPAKPVVKQLLEWLIADGEFPDHPYNPDDHGYIALVEPGDEDRELDDIDIPRLTDIMWEGASIIDGFYHAVYLGVGDFGIGLVIPVDAPWLSGELSECPLVWAIADCPADRRMARRISQTVCTALSGLLSRFCLIVFPPGLTMDQKSSVNQSTLSVQLGLT